MFTRKDNIQIIIKGKKIIKTIIKLSKTVEIYFKKCYSV